MDTRKLGKNGPAVSALGLGCMGMTGIYGEPNEAESIATIHRAIDLGVNLIVTSDAYAAGNNEELVGRALKGKRSRVLLATKFGNVGLSGFKLPEGLSAGHPAYVPQACDASLKRLGVEVIDIYGLHRVDPKVPIEDTVGAMSRLVDAGKVRFLGLSEAAPPTIRRAHKVHPLAAVQMEYSLLYRVEAEQTLPTLRELGISLVAYSPLGRSLLTGQVHKVADIPADDRRRQHPRFEEANLERNVQFVRKVEQFARDKGCTPGQLVLAWLLAQGRDIVPIPGTKRRDRLEENVRSADVRLSADEAARLSNAVPVGAAAGLRYPEPQMKAVFI